ncbi:MAG: aspartate kinase [Candidatus Levybacteria bacterium]|nr:aspartate kinase [Candidatus Levybacteria bacterium]
MAISERFLQSGPMPSGSVEGIGAKEKEPINNICVMKFGGTSVGSAEAIERVAGIVEAYRRNGNPIVVVVSAMSGVTEELIKVCDNIAVQNNQGAIELINNLQERHFSTCLQLNMPSLWKLDLQGELNSLFDQLREEANRDGLMLDGRRDSILSFGERLSAKIVAARLGLLAEPVDASIIIETNDKFGDAAPNMKRTRKNVREAIPNLIRRGRIPVITGFIGATPDGRRTTLGRGGSDYTASILGWALGSREVFIWTDVDGVYSGDPRKDPTAVLIPEMSFVEADKVARNGGKVLCPKTLEPFLGLNGDAKTVVWVKNTFNPDSQGTRISHSSQL